MEIQASRSAARVGPKGEPILLLDQDRRRWNQLLIQRGLTALARAERLRPRARARTRCKRRSPRAMPARGRPIRPTGSASRRSTTSSRRSCRRRSSSSIARSRTGWRSARSKGLEVVEPLVGNPALSEYPYLPGVRADLLFKLKRFDEAKVEFEKAAALTKNASQRALLLQKAADCSTID